MEGLPSLCIASVCSPGTREVSSIVLKEQKNYCAWTEQMLCHAVLFGILNYEFLIVFYFAHSFTLYVQI
jgi:hypothetical protein